VPRKSIEVRQASNREETTSMRTATLTGTTRVALCCLVLGAASGCSARNKSAADADSASEAMGPGVDSVSRETPSLSVAGPDVPGPDPRPCAAIPAACPSPQPSYARDIAPIFAAKCTTCHSEEVDSGPWPLTEYEYISDWQSAVLADIEYCTMPPAGAPPLTSAEQDAILAWIVCNAPEN